MFIQKTPRALANFGVSTYQVMVHDIIISVQTSLVDAFADLLMARPVFGIEVTWCPRLFNYIDHYVLKHPGVQVTKQMRILSVRIQKCLGI